jgi:hypothetical protein
MEIQDDRTAEQRQTHRFLIIGTDKFMSGWGKAEGGTSYAAWACRAEHRKAVFEWVESRSDMKRVRESYSDWKPRGRGHAHIYVVEPGHPALVSYIRMRLEHLRCELRRERISYGELAELQSLESFIDKSDVELLQAAGVPESAAQ